MVPFDSQDLKGVVYVWIGGLAEHEDAVVAEKIAYKMYQVSSTLKLSFLSEIVFSFVLDFYKFFDWFNVTL